MHAFLGLALLNQMVFLQRGAWGKYSYRHIVSCYMFVDIHADILFHAICLLHSCYMCCANSFAHSTICFASQMQQCQMFSPQTWMHSGIRIATIWRHWLITGCAKCVVCVSAVVAVFMCMCRLLYVSFSAYVSGCYSMSSSSSHIAIGGITQPFVS